MNHRSGNRRTRNHHSSNHSTRVLCLTEEEATALLEICLHSKTEDDALKSRVMEKVGELCREFIKAGGSGAPAIGIHGDRSQVREALDALLHLRSIPETACA